MEEKMLNLIEKAKKGDETAFKMIYDRYYKQAYYYALKLCRNNEADAYDVTQETFLSIHTYLPNLNNPEYFVAWMSKIVFSKCTKLFRAHKDIYVDQATLVKMSSQETKIEYLPKASFSERSDKEIVHKLINELSPVLAQSLRYIYFDQLPYKDVADKLNIPVGTVKSRVNQGRNLLKEKVKGFEIREGRKLDFKLEPITTSGALLGLLMKGKSILTGSVLQTASIVTLSGLTILSCIGAYQILQQDPIIKEAANEHLILQDIESVETFPTLYYGNKEIKTAKSAYYTLMQWAANKNEMQEHKNEDLDEIYSVVKALENSNSAYKDMLERQGWILEFNKI